MARLAFEHASVSERCWKEVTLGIRVGIMVRA